MANQQQNNAAMLASVKVRITAKEFAAKYRVSVFYIDNADHPCIYKEQTRSLQLPFRGHRHLFTRI